MLPSLRSRRVTYTRGQLDIRISFVIAQQHIEARLLLLDEIIFKRQRLFFVVHHNVVNVHRLAHQRAGFSLVIGAFYKVIAHPGAQVLGLANVNHRPLGVLVQIHARPHRQSTDFLSQVHFNYWIRALPPVTRIASANGIFSC